MTGNSQMMGPDPRPSIWRSRFLWCSFAVLVVALAGLTVLMLTIFPPDARRPARWWQPLVSIAVWVPWFAFTVYGLLAIWRRGRDLRRDPMLAAVVAQRAGVLALAPQDAFDAALRALGAVPAARIDPDHTSVALGRLRATTGPRPFAGPGEQIEVQLFAVDEGRVAVFATSDQKYRGGGENRPKNDWNLLRLFSALPVERPYDTTRPWQAPAS